MDSDCPHGYASRASCTDCMYDGPVSPPRPTPTKSKPQSFTARFDGHCAECNLPIVPDQTITIADGSHYVHLDCLT